MKSITTTGKLAHLMQKHPNRSKSWYRKQLGLNSKYFRKYLPIVVGLLAGVTAVGASPAPFNPDNMVTYAD